jgi:hypothetical protein
MSRLLGALCAVTLKLAVLFAAPADKPAAAKVAQTPVNAVPALRAVPAPLPLAKPYPAVAPWKTLEIAPAGFLAIVTPSEGAGL